MQFWGIGRYADEYEKLYLFYPAGVAISIYQR